MTSTHDIRDTADNPLRRALATPGVRDAIARDPREALPAPATGEIRLSMPLTETPASGRALALAALLTRDYAERPGRFPTPAFVAVGARGEDTPDADGPVATVQDRRARGMVVTLFGRPSDPVGEMTVDLYARMRKAEIDLGDGRRATFACNAPMVRSEAMQIRATVIEHSPA